MRMYAESGILVQCEIVDENDLAIWIMIEGGDGFKGVFGY
jgi:hypothetical protein